jgi:hypothetical protein
MSRQPATSPYRHAIRPGNSMNPRRGDPTRLRVVGVGVSGKAVSKHGGRRKRRNRLWRHPFKHCIRVPYRIAAAIAVIEMGISEYSVIARAVGLTVEEVERVDMAEDASVRRLIVARIPVGEWFKLDDFVRCPKCLAKVRLAPCVACRSS